MTVSDDGYCNLHFQWPVLDAWVYLITSHIIFVVGIGIPLSILTYYFTSRKERQRQKILACVPLAVLVALSIPWYFNYYSTKNHNHQRDVTTMDYHWLRPFLGSTFGFSSAMKLWNVAFSQYPKEVDMSLSRFMNWFLLLPEPKYSLDDHDKADNAKKMTNSTSTNIHAASGGEKKTNTTITMKDKPVYCVPRFYSAKQIRNHVWKIIWKVIFLCLLLSILRTPSKKIIISSPNRIRSNSNVILCAILQTLPIEHSDDLTLIQEAWNGWIHLWWLYTWLSLFLDLSILISFPITGCQVMESAFKNPLIESRSIQEAWGTRWNSPVQLLLQRTVYIPLRKSGFDRIPAILGTFGVSGLLHEYLFWTHNYIAYSPGIPTLFFLGMGLLMILEQ